MGISYRQATEWKLRQKPSWKWCIQRSPAGDTVHFGWTLTFHLKAQRLNLFVRRVHFARAACETLLQIARGHT